MGVGGELVGVVAELEFDGAEEFVIGLIDEFLGHAACGLFEEGQQLGGQGPDATFTIFAERGRRRWLRL